MSGGGHAVVLTVAGCSWAVAGKQRPAVSESRRALLAAFMID